MTIAVLGILVLLAAPRLLGYTEKAELTRIRHDVKVMEQEMDIALIENKEDFVGWDDNGKDLGKLILSDKLYEKEGFAKNIEKSHLARYYESMRSNPSELGVGGETYAIAATADEVSEVDLMTSLGYKIIPAQYSSKINTELKGTFYSNDEGKVYYENDKALKSQKDEPIIACDAPVAESLGYTFEIINGKGTITKYDHREQNIVIPSAFKIEVDGEEVCEPVRVIGKGAFAYGPLKKLKLESVIIPGSVEAIEEDAFKDNNIPKITIPSSVKVVEDNILIGNNISHIIVRGESGSSPIKEINYPGVNIEYNYGTPKDLDIIFDYNSGTIIDYSGSGGEYIEVPKFVTQNGINYPVKGIAKGAYQGEGLISVILPETLERIEDYAFSGNQLIGITIPNSVVHIGNYAFSFNERLVSGEMAATMKTVIMKNLERFDKIDKSGNILENQGGLKVDLLDGTLTLLDHIFVTSIGNKVEFLEDGPPLENPDIPVEDPTTGPLPDETLEEQSGPIIFSGLDPKAWDGQEKTYDSFGGTKKLTWTGNLNRKEIRISYRTESSAIISFTFYDEENNKLSSLGKETTTINGSSGSNIDGVIKLFVPTNAARIEINSTSKWNRIYEIYSPKVLSAVEIQKITTTPKSSGIHLKWAKKQQVIIMKDNIVLFYGFGDEFEDKYLQPNTTHKYQFIFLDENGNGSRQVEASDTVENRSVVFNGLDPKAWDEDEKTHFSFSGTKNITWIGDLNRKEISISYHTESSGKISFTFYDEENNKLSSLGEETTTINGSSGSNIDGVIKLFVPTNAARIEINSTSKWNRIYEIYSPKVLSAVEIQKITTTPKK